MRAWPTVVCLAVLLRDDQVREDMANGFLAGPPEHGFGGAVPVDDDAAIVD
jgi:hypothetical protein